MFDISKPGWPLQTSLPINSNTINTGWSLPALRSIVFINSSAIALERAPFTPNKYKHKTKHKHRYKQT